MAETGSDGLEERVIDGVAEIEEAEGAEAAVGEDCEGAVTLVVLVGIGDVWKFVSWQSYNGTDVGVDVFGGDAAVLLEEFACCVGFRGDFRQECCGVFGGCC